MTARINCHSLHFQFLHFLWFSLFKSLGILDTGGKNNNRPTVIISIQRYNFVLIYESFGDLNLVPDL